MRLLLYSLSKDPRSRKLTCILSEGITEGELGAVIHRGNHWSSWESQLGQALKRPPVKSQKLLQERELVLNISQVQRLWSHLRTPLLKNEVFSWPPHHNHVGGESSQCEGRRRGNEWGGQQALCPEGLPVSQSQGGKKRTSGEVLINILD